MKKYTHPFLAVLTAFFLLTYVMAPQPLRAAERRVVELSELRADLRQAHQARAQDLADVERVLALPQAQEALAKTGLSANQVELAIAELNDDELSRLAERARAAEQDVEGGILIGILALIGLIVVIAVVVSVVNDNDD